MPALTIKNNANHQDTKITKLHQEMPDFPWCNLVYFVPWWFAFSAFPQQVSANA
jgi:hypothetical protein